MLYNLQWKIPLKLMKKEGTPTTQGHLQIDEGSNPRSTQPTGALLRQIIRFTANPNAHLGTIETSHLLPGGSDMI